MKLKHYFTLYQLFEFNPSTPSQNRAFGLKHAELKSSPKAQLLLWIAQHEKRLPRPLLSETFSSYLYGVTFGLVFIAFVLGLLSGFGLLSYNGREPVNVIYFIVMVMFVPLFTMLLALVSMLRAGRSSSVLVHLSPAFWMEKVLGLLPNSFQEEIKNIQINPLLANWLIIKRSQLIALCFSLGLLVALIGDVVTQDIAFAWSTTLHISPEGLYGFLETMALPWATFLPSGVPSLELIEQSQYFRLGDKLSSEMISNASSLGEWWQFLTASTLFYAIFLRSVMLWIAGIGLDYATQSAIFSLRGTQKLLGEINQPIISTHATEEEAIFTPNDHGYRQIIKRLKPSYDGIQGWAIPHDELLVLSESMRVTAPSYKEVGGANSFAEDNAIVAQSQGEILLFVKAWEPPTMDFVDYLSDLRDEVEKVIVMPVGTIDKGYSTTDKAIDVWANKLSLTSDMKVWLKR